jgi:hypothetical protein
VSEEWGGILEGKEIPIETCLNTQRCISIDLGHEKTERAKRQIKKSSPSKPYGRHEG